MQAITRREFLELAIGIPCLYSAPLLAAPAVGSRFQGCFLTSGSDDFLDKLNFLLSSNDTEVDQICSAAERELRREFKVAPDTWFYDDVGDRTPSPPGFSGAVEQFYLSGIPRPMVPSA